MSSRIHQGGLCAGVVFLGLLGAVGVALGQASRESSVVINEIYYDPGDNSDPLEFVELYNAGTVAVDLGGWSFAKGITYAFPQGTSVAAGRYVVVAEDPAALKKAFGVTCLGPFEGHLDNDGEKVTLVDATGRLADEVDYKASFPWPCNTNGRSIELINPELDNDLGGSWRLCGYAETQDPGTAVPGRTLVATGTDHWRLRKGVSEPAAGWTGLDYAEDRFWEETSVKAPIGYDTKGTYTIATSLPDMQNKYSTVYLRHTFGISFSEGIPGALTLRLLVDDGCIVWINGVEVARCYVSGGPQAYNALATTHDAAWETFTLTSPVVYLRAGSNVVAVQVINRSLDSSDLLFDMELSSATLVRGQGSVPPPTPGAANSVLAANAPPQIRQVNHTPQQPKAGQPIVVAAKITDPDGVAGVSLAYQVVRPGHYIPACLPVPLSTLIANADTARPRNPDFEAGANWTTITMDDDGTGSDAVASDGVFTAVIPGQVNRCLVRYRITAVDAAGQPLSVTVPYVDDPSLNFACWVYDGIPPYVASQSVLGSPHTYSPEVLQTLPVYTLITRAQDLAQCYAYKSSDRSQGNNSPARKAFNWEGAFVYDGKVYDHINYRLRGANGRYDGAGKRSMKIHFNHGAEFQARDRYGRPYPKGWRDINVSKMFDNRTYNDYGDSNFGLTETMNSILWNLAGVPTWDTYWFHFRVVDGEQEAPNQYQGDFWGMFLAMEDYDGRFIERQGMPDGNLYKFSAGNTSYLDEERHLARDSVSDGSDCRRVDISGANALTWGKTEAQLRQLVNYEEYFGYLTVCEAVRQYDNDYAGERRNIAWYFEPDPTGQNPLGWLWLLPYDTDLTWGPNWNDGPQQPWRALEPGGNDGKAHTDNPGGMTSMKMEFRNYVREFRDLLWNPETIDPMLDGLVDLIKDFAPADQDRWTHVPSSAYGSDTAGLHVVGQHNTFTWSVQDKAADMKLFAFIGNHTWSSGNISGYVPVGGRAAVLDQISGFEGDTTAIPSTPTLAYIGPAGHPLASLKFTASTFMDPQGTKTFGAMKWRIAEVSDITSEDYDPANPKYETLPLWESGEITPYAATVTIPSTGLQEGHLYRVRVRMKDSTGRWGHWSQPEEFRPGK
jgi:hypothetical protein